MEQFRVLRGELEENQREMRNNERYLIIATAAIWSFLATKDLPSEWVEGIGWAMPFFLALIGFGRACLLNSRIYHLATYIGLAEAYFKLENIDGRLAPKGWEHYLESMDRRQKVGSWIERRKTPKLTRHVFPPFIVWFWGVAAGVTALIATLVVLWGLKHQPFND